MTVNRIKSRKLASVKEELRKAKLEAKELRAQLASTYHFASVELPSCRDVQGGGVLVELHFLGGRQACMPFVIRDGLSSSTIKALQEDLSKSWSLSTELKPADPK